MPGRKQKHSPRKGSPRVAPTPPMGKLNVSPKAPISACPFAAAAATPGAAAAVQPIVVESQPEVIAVADEVAPTRSAVIDALPEFGNVTGLTAVESGISIFITPLRSHQWAEFYFDEATSCR